VSRWVDAQWLTAAWTARSFEVGSLFTRSIMKVRNWRCLLRSSGASSCRVWVGKCKGRDGEGKGSEVSRSETLATLGRSAPRCSVCSPHSVEAAGPRRNGMPPGALYAAPALPAEQTEAGTEGGAFSPPRRRAPDRPPTHTPHTVVELRQETEKRRTTGQRRDSRTSALVAASVGWYRGSMAACFTCVWDRWGGGKGCFWPGWDTGGPTAEAKGAKRGKRGKSYQQL
jgi:hypothetical protein